MRTIIIGDVHGCLDELKELLLNVEYDINKDKLILLGDYIDRGEYSYETLKFLKKLKDEAKDNLILIRGNHEVKFIKFRHPIDSLIWHLGGRKATIESFKKNGKELKHFNKWLKENTVIYYEDKKFQCCHASIRNEKIEKNRKYTLTTNRWLAKKNKYNGKLTIHGHVGVSMPLYLNSDPAIKTRLPFDSTLKLPKNGVILLDTMCVLGRKLTAMVIEDNKYILKYVNRKR